MKKIPTLYARNPGNRRYVTDELAVLLPDDSVSTEKIDGTCVMFDGERWWARRELRRGGTEPEGWVFVNFDETTGKTIGWEPAERSGFYKYLIEAVDNETLKVESGTYELYGPKINGNTARVKKHRLYRHGTRIPVYPWNPGWTADVVKRWVLALPAQVEGIVWWYEDEPIAKLKKRDINPE